MADAQTVRLYIMLPSSTDLLPVSLLEEDIRQRLQGTLLVGLPDKE